MEKGLQEVFAVEGRKADENPAEHGKEDVSLKEKRKGGFLNFFRRKQEEEVFVPEPQKQEKEQDEVFETKLEKNTMPEKLKDSKLYFQTIEDQMNEACMQMQQAKTEYGAVTSYLTDIQKIDRMPQEEHAVAVDAAKRIVACTRERENLRSRVIRITKDQYQMAEQYEEELPAVIKNMKSNEDSLVVTKNDMRFLEGEKGQLIYEHEELVKKQKRYQGLVSTVLVLLASLFVLFFVLYLQAGLDIRLPIMFSLALAAAAGSYVFLKSRNTKNALLLNERKINKAISLLNMTKIRYVNYSSTVEYMQTKYHVSNSMEMNYIWAQYMKSKEEEKRYMRNSQMLELYHGVLTAQMKKTGLEDPEIWVYQPEAVADEKEMVEVRHRLNDRRGKLREKIEYNQEIVATLSQELLELVQKEPEHAKQVADLLQKFGVMES